MGIFTSFSYCASTSNSMPRMLISSRLNRLFECVGVRRDTSVSTSYTAFCPLLVVTSIYASFFLAIATSIRQGI